MADRTLHADDLLCFFFNFEVDLENTKVIDSIKQLYSLKDIINSKKTLIKHVESLLNNEKLKLPSQSTSKETEIQSILQIVDYININKLESKLPIYAATNLKKVPCFMSGLKPNEVGDKNEKIQQQLNEIKDQLQTVMSGMHKPTMYSTVAAKNIQEHIQHGPQSPRSLPRIPAIQIQIPSQQTQQLPSLLTQQTNAFTVVKKKQRPIKNIRGTNNTGLCPKSAGAIVKKKIYFVTNLDVSVDNENLTEYLSSNKIKVLSCFEAKSHRGKGFRVCIDANSSNNTFTDPVLWAEDTIIREWVFKPNNTANTETNKPVTSANEKNNDG